VLVGLLGFIAESAFETGSSLQGDDRHHLEVNGSHRCGTGVACARHARRKEHTMSTIEQSVEVEAPLSTIYKQWTQFEEFPRFTQGVEEVRQLDDTHLHGVAEFAGSRHEWDAEMTEQKPDERVAWRNTDGKDNAGVVTFHRLDDVRTRVMVQVDFVPEGIKEKLGGMLGAPDRRVKGDRERFKKLMESRGAETAGWRGEVERPRST
jgi:uncharacterized membrane protein